MIDRPDSDSVDIWIAQPETLPHTANDLSSAEKAKVNAMATPELRNRQIARRCFLRSVLSKYTSSDPMQMRLVLANTGKPSLADSSGLRFNMSHGKGTSVLAIGEMEMGLDFEPFRSLNDLEMIAKKTCSPREITEIIRDENPERAFFERWVRKEAILKCIGTGLIEDLPQIDPGPSNLPQTLWRGMSLYPVSVGSLCAAALATTRPVERIVVRQWTGSH